MVLLLQTGSWFFSVFNDNQERLVFGLVIQKQKEHRYLFEKVGRGVRRNEFLMVDFQFDIKMKALNSTRMIVKSIISISN